VTIQLPTPSGQAAESVLGRVSPLVKLGVAAAWLIGLIATLDPRAPIVLTAAALVAAIVLGRVSPGEFARGALPLWAAAVVIGAFNALFSAENSNPLAVELTRVGPLRVTESAVLAGLAIALRVVAIAAASVLFARTTDPTVLADSLVQQARLPERFAYGALAAYQALPRLGDDLLSLRQARRIRGLRASWHPSVLVGLLALAVRHADRVAIAMDARAFGLGPRSRFRELRWSLADAYVGASGVAVLAIALLATRT
jgi:energy-coupling factor transport system permease protein